MRLLFAGTPEAALPSLDALLRSRHEVIAVLTRPDAPVGRGRRLEPSPVARRALDAGIELLRPERAADPGFLARLRELAPDCCPVVAYGALLPRDALDVPPAGWVNLHFSLLPAWRGAAPVQHAIWHGDDITGATTFLLEEGLDTGPVLGVVTEQVRPTDTSGELLGRLAISGADLLVATLDGLANGALVPTPQPADGVTYAEKISKSESRIDWSKPARDVHNHIRGLSPFPGAWFEFDGTRVKVLRSTLGVGSGAPGTALDDALTLACGDGAVRLVQVQREGKRAMSAEEFLRGNAVGKGVVVT